MRCDAMRIFYVNLAGSLDLLAFFFPFLHFSSIFPIIDPKFIRSFIYNMRVPVINVGYIFTHLN